MKPEDVTTHKLENYTPCPVAQCGKNLDGVTGGSTAPGEGDATVCAYCLTWLIFKEDLQLREMTEDEITGLDEENFQTLSKFSQLIARVQREQ